MGVCDSQSATRTSAGNRNMAEMLMHKKKSVRNSTKCRSSVEIQYMKSGLPNSNQPSDFRPEVVLVFRFSAHVQ